MKPENLIRANELEKEIKEVKYFLTTIGNTSKEFEEHKIAFVNIETKRTISFFGSRSFGCGSHNSNIVIPNVTLDLLVNAIKYRLHLLEVELDNL